MRAARKSRVQGNGKRTFTLRSDGLTDFTAERLARGPLLHFDLLDALGVAVYTTDAAGRITMYNEAAVAMWGREPRAGVDQWCGSWRLFYPDGRPMGHDECPMAIALRENRPVRGEEAMAERPDGSRVSFLAAPTPLRDTAGNLVGAVNVLVDVTERNRAVAEAERQRRLVQAITENMSVGLLMIDRSGRIEFMNPAAEKITGCRFEDVRGKIKHQVLHHLRPDGSAFPEDECPIEIANQTLTRLTGHEDVFVRPDGSPYHVRCNVAPMVAGGESLGAIIDLRDATEEKKAEEAIRRSMAVKDQFLSLVSHELRTPIATILGNALVLLRRGEALSPDSRRQALSDVADEAGKLQRIIENLLLLTRVEAGEKVETEPLRLPQIVEQATASFQRRNSRRTIFVKAGGTPPLVLGQPAFLTLVMDNLLANADKYSPPGAPIEVWISENGEDAVQVCVRDYGLGIDEGEAEEIFTPFYRSEKAKTRAKGIGLGLAVCKRVIEAQGGRIWAERRPEGGSDFVFTLERIPDSAIDD